MAGVSGNGHAMASAGDMGALEGAGSLADLLEKLLLNGDVQLSVAGEDDYGVTSKPKIISWSQGPIISWSQAPVYSTVKWEIAPKKNWVEFHEYSYPHIVKWGESLTPGKIGKGKGLGGKIEIWGGKGPGKDGIKGKWGNVLRPKISNLGKSAEGDIEPNPLGDESKGLELNFNPKNTLPNDFGIRPKGHQPNEGKGSEGEEPIPNPGVFDGPNGLGLNMIPKLMPGMDFLPKLAKSMKLGGPGDKVAAVWSNGDNDLNGVIK